jgi:hypothetical protein
VRRIIKNREVEKQCKSLAEQKNVVIRKYHLNSIVCFYEAEDKWASKDFPSWEAVLAFLNSNDKLATA